jgi:hypothetical protein
MVLVDYIGIFFYIFEYFWQMTVCVYNFFLCYNKEKASNAFFGTNVNKSVYFFMYGFRLTFAVFMDRDLPNSFSAASF